MSSYLVPDPEAAGVSGEAQWVEENIFDEQGNVRSHEDLTEKVGGDMHAFLIRLEYELRERLRRPHTRGYPPRIFISYRRETPEDIAWTVRLAEELTKNGYEVLLDEWVLGKPALDDDGHYEDVARFMSMMVEADIALLVVSEGYINHEGQANMMRNWIYEEWIRIALLDDQGLLETVVVHRSGEMGGDSFFPLPGARSTCLDLREQPDDPSPVLEFFGQAPGPRIEEEDQLRLATRAAEVVELTRGNFEEHDHTALAKAVSALEDIADLGGTEEYGVAIAHFCGLLGDREKSRSAALTMLAANPSISNGCALAWLLWMHDYGRDAFAAMAELSEGPSRSRNEMRLVMGDILKAEGLFQSAANQYKWVLATDGTHLAGFRLSMPPAGRTAMESRLSKLIPLLKAGYSLECDHCNSLFPLEWKICVHCGTTHEGESGCNMCKGDPPLSQLSSELEFCPVCRKMENGGNAYLVPREPKGRWSVLAP